jgi:hypothetical protein
MIEQGEIRRMSVDDTEAAREGTCAAWVAEMVLTGQYEKCSDLVGKTHPENMWPVDHVMARHIQGYVDMITARGGIISAERSVTLTPNIKGTPDAFAVIEHGLHGNTLYVDDLKYGFGIVEPTSYQVFIYAAAILNELKSHEDRLRIDQVQLGIYQPRSSHYDGVYRTIRLSAIEYHEQLKVVFEAESKALEPNPVTIPGRHCKYCPAAASCQALTSELYDIYHMVQAKANRSMTTQEMADEKRFLDRVDDMLSARKKAVEAEMNALMDSGKNIPGWTRKSGYGNRQWKYPEGMVRALMPGYDPTAGKMVTPAEMQRRGVDPDLLEKLTEKPRTKAKLVEITQDDFKDAFGDIS